MSKVLLYLSERPCNVCNVMLTSENANHSKIMNAEYYCIACYNKKACQRRLQEKQALMNVYGGQCSCCHEKELIFLTIDHKDGNGAEDRKLLRGGGGGFYQDLKKRGYPRDNYQVLCYNCNVSKQILGTCYHTLDDNGAHNIAKPLIRVGTWHAPGICRRCGCVINETNNRMLRGKEDTECRNCYNADAFNCSLLIKIETMNAYGGKCQCCGVDELSVLAIDHIHNDGAIKRKETGIIGGTKLYRYLRRNSYPRADYQVLCFNCNFSKRFGVCPHNLLPTP